MLDVLAKRYTTILVGGAHVAVVPALEDCMQGGYRNVVRSVVDAAQPRRGEPIVEIGCGPGAVVRWLPHHLTPDNPIMGVDVNSFLLLHTRT